MARHERRFDQAQPVTGRAIQGKTSYLAGLAAEDIVARAYADAGYELVTERWHGRRGEIDLIFSTAVGIVMVEVKASKDFASALQHLTPTKIARLYATADEYMAKLSNGTLTDVFPDLACAATEFETAAWVLYPSRSYLPRKVRVTIDFLREVLNAGA